MKWTEHIGYRWGDADGGWGKVDIGLWHRVDGRGSACRLEFSDEEVWVACTDDFMLPVDTAREAMTAVDWVLQARDLAEDRSEPKVRP